MKLFSTKRMSWIKTDSYIVGLAGGGGSSKNPIDLSTEGWSLTIFGL